MEDVKLPLTAHLEELRSRLIKSLIALGVAFVACYQVVEPLIRWLVAPVKQFDPKRVQIIGTGLAEAFFTKLKVAFFAGIFLARPVIVNHKMMLGAWRYSVVGIFIIAAVLTPGPDVASQMLMATPLLVLYAASIGVAYAFAKPPHGGTDSPAAEPPDEPH